ncbi:MAG: DUF6655 family protein [Verrucomicrobiota bacterium]
MFSSRSFYLSLLAGFSLVFAGCTTPTIPDQQRTALEQLVNSTAVDKSIEQFSIPEVDGRKVYFDGRYIEGYDEGYVIASLRDLLSRSGAHLVEYREQADMVVEGRSGALGFDLSDALVGIPSLAMAFPGLGGFQTPELALYKNVNADGVAKLALLGYEREGGAPVFSTGAIAGDSYFYHYSFLLIIDINFTDIPERDDY